MDGEDAPNSGGTPKKALWRSASWTVRSSSTSAPAPAPNPNPSSRAHHPPKPRSSCLPPLQPLSISRRPLVDEWPRPACDDSGEWPHHHNPPSTPSSHTNKLSLLDRECSRVDDHIYLGSDAVARDRDALRRHGITHVLNCVGSASPEYFRGDLVYKTLWLHDSPAEDITSVLYDAFDYLEEVRAHPSGRVLVHCLRGASRSAALVIAYLMWRHAQSFDDALRHVRAARSVTDPNIGFASQLLQCQNRVHALPPSPGSALRAYRMAPHSPYDPLHLVPKALDRPCPARLDSRGAFLVHVPSVIYVWSGRDCEPALASSATVAALQLVRYEKAQGPIVKIREGSEPKEFWSALMYPADVGDMDLDTGVVGKRRVELYDLDFEIFRRALKGGVVPPLPMSGTGSETRLPARESGWSRLRQKFISGRVRKFLTSATASSHEEESRDPFGSPCSFSGVSSTTPSSSSADSASTLSTFSPASSSSSDWYNSSPPGSELYIVPLHLVSSLPPLHSRKGKEKVSSSPPSSRTLAERRGSRAPSLVLLPLSDDCKGQFSQFSHGDIVRDWSFSPPFIPEVEGDRRTMDIEQPMSLDPPEEGEEKGNSGRDEDTQLIQPILFRWPGMEKMEVLHPGLLDSGSVFLLLAPDRSLGIRKQKAKILYVWVGRQSHLISCSDGSGGIGEEDRQIYLDKIKINFLDQMGLPMDIPVQIIRDQEEPEQFLNHLFSFHKAECNSHN